MRTTVRSPPATATKVSPDQPPSIGSSDANSTRTTLRPVPADDRGGVERVAALLRREHAGAFRGARVEQLGRADPAVPRRRERTRPQGVDAERGRHRVPHDAGGTHLQHRPAYGGGAAD